MPLTKGCGKKSRSTNIAELRRSGRSATQAAAIAYSTQRKAGCKPKPKLKKRR